MGEIARIFPPRAPRPADHVALRALIKYMSSVLTIGYKTIAGENSDETTVKNYVNDKSMKSDKAKEVYLVLSGNCQGILADVVKSKELDSYVTQILVHLFGEQWVRSTNISLSSGLTTSPDSAIAKWLSVSDDRTAQVEARYGGLWRVLRFSSPAAASGEGSTSRQSDVNYSLLNIRPRSVRAGTLCDFSWYYLGRGRESDEFTVFEGYVIPNVDRIEFLGRAKNNHDLVTLMVWRFTSNPELTEHARVSNGQALALNTSGHPVSARVRAFFVEGSDQVHGDEFDALKAQELKLIGVDNNESLRDRIPSDQHDKTWRYLSEFKPIVGFFSSKDDTGDG